MNPPIDKEQKHYCYQILYKDCKSKSAHDQLEEVGVEGRKR